MQWYPDSHILDSQLLALQKRHRCISSGQRVTPVLLSWHSRLVAPHEGRSRASLPLLNSQHFFLQDQRAEHPYHSQQQPLLIRSSPRRYETATTSTFPKVLSFRYHLYPNYL
eukprot:TRINITY_DN64234_c0_g1_i1.p1 TRINITY_DN64234_c0_g1~~TRINITY_DN64234_c0_g1_i1.p1  ORF type:complete len:112 (+),score=8.63 TRINITY_DN64234_c0_g1_i1:83-418(+)